MGFLPFGNSGCFPLREPAATKLPLGKPATAESPYPTYGTRWVFQCFHNPPYSDVDSEIFNVRRDVNAYDCRQGVRTT